MQNKYIYVETPKNACSSTKLSLMHIEGLEPPANLGDVHVRSPNDGRPSLFDLGYDGTLALLESKEYTKFCVFRDPTRRLFSAFRNKLCNPELKNYDAIRKSIMQEHSVSDFREVRFAQFAEWVCNQPDEMRDHHYRSQWSLNLCDYIDYDFVVRMDNYASDMTLLARRLDLSDKQMPDFKKRTNVSNSEATKIPLGVTKQINRVYEKDFEILSMHKGGYE